MIKIKALFIGDGIKSFVETGFGDRVNVIWSDDNNVGKTIVIQGIMYALGSQPAFPKNFPHLNTIFIVDLDVRGRQISVLRSRNTFAVREAEEVLTFESVEAFSEYWSNNITSIPSIIKKGIPTSVGLGLYSQMYFVSQDARSSSRIQAGRFNKDDFVEMVYAIKGLDARELTPQEEAELKSRKAELKQERKSLERQATVLRDKDAALALMSPTADRAEMDELLKRLAEAKNIIAELRKRRNRLLRRLTKNEIVQKELNSLRIDVKAGQIVCLDCGSAHIGYKMADSGYTFDITTPQMRDQILASVQQRIDACNSELEQVNSELREAQRHLDVLLDEKPVTLADVVVRQEDYANERGLDEQITRIDDELATIEAKLDSHHSVQSDLKTRREEFMEELLGTMDHVRRQISVSENPDACDKLFTTNANVYSGSETTEYFLARCVALARHIDHEMPILIDSFRAEDLSTMREDRVLDIYHGLGYQALLTTTVKAEEGAGKYSNDARVHSIDYSGHTAFHLLSDEYNDAFNSKMNEFGAVLT